MNKRKIVKWLMMGTLTLGALFLILTALFLNRGKAAYREFATKNAGAPERAAALARAMSETWRSGNAGERNTAPTHPAASAVVDEFQRKTKEIERLGHNSGFDFLDYSELGRGGLILILPAADFPEEGARGALRGGAALRERIRAAAARMLHPRQPGEEGDIIMAPLKRPLTPALERTEAFLSGEGSMPDRDLIKLSAPSHTYASAAYTFEGLASLAAMRAGLQGRPGAAGAMLRRMIQYILARRIDDFPSLHSFKHVWITLEYLVERGGLRDEDLAEADRMLARTRLSDSQLADLRAAYVMRLGERLREMQSDPHGGAIEYAVEKTILAGAHALSLAELRPVAAAWAGSDEKAYESAVNSPLFLPFDLPLMMSAHLFPYDRAAFAAENAANKNVDFTRLILAAARYRLAAGRYPEHLEELMPRYLESSFNARKESFWGVDRATGGKDGAARPGRPIFYLARRASLTTQCAIGVQFLSNELGFASVINQTGILSQHSSSGVYREALSGKREEAIVVEIYWPHDEKTQRWWTRLAGEEPGMEKSGTGAK